MDGPTPIRPTGIHPSPGGEPINAVTMLRNTTHAISNCLKNLTYPMTTDQAFLGHVSNLIISAASLAKKVTQGG